MGTELTRERNPDLWASAQYKCGLALAQLGKYRTDSVMFGRAETAFRQALKVWTSGPDHDKGIEALAKVLQRQKDRANEIL